MPASIAFDLSVTCTGVATWTRHGYVTDRIRPKGLDGAARRAFIARRVANAVWATQRRHGDCLVVLEQPFAGGHAGATMSLAMLHGVVYDRLTTIGVRWAQVPPALVKQAATGKGNAPKPKILSAAQAELGYLGKSLDEADALWLALIGHHVAGGTDHLTPQRQALLGKVTWPEGLPDRGVA